jgi:hypothetical protein
MLNQLNGTLRKVLAFEREAHAILSKEESARSRVVNLRETYRSLNGLSLKQDELFRQGLRCVEKDLFRAAHVMAWAGFMDFLEEKLASDGFLALRSARPSWKFGTVEDLRESQTEHAIIEACKEVGLCAKSEMKALLGLLNKRNECAHPSDYFPGLNETLGYFSELFQRIGGLRTRSVPAHPVP